MLEDHNGWDEYKRVVVDRLDRLDNSVSALSGKIDYLVSNDLSHLKVEIAVLKIKAGLWGLVGASIPSSIAIIVYYLKF